MADGGPCPLPLPHSVIQSISPPPAEQAWCLHRQVFPQHTDHAGVMWHGAYLAWLEEARVEALAAVGLAYSQLSRGGLELPVVHLSMTYKAPLLHGDRVELRSLVLPRRGLRVPWQSWFIGPAGQVAARALVDLALVDFSAGAEQRRLPRQPPADLAAALASLAAGPSR
jgi:acyl-CoA thioester hydrolase